MPTISHNTLFIGKVLNEYDTLTSTNGRAAEMLSKSNPIEGTVISALHQTQGRGQFGSKWESEPGKNITISVILRPKFLPPSENFMLNIISSLAVKDFLQDYTSKQLFVKWPNDIFVADRKIGGILIQNIISERKNASSIIGIGVNINQIEFTAEAGSPISLKILEGADMDIESLLQPLYYHLETRYLQLKNGKSDLLRGDYIASLYKLNERSAFIVDEIEMEALIRGVASDGQLIIENSEGNEMKFWFKEIEMII